MNNTAATVKRGQLWRSHTWCDGDRQPVVWKVFAVKHGGSTVYYGWPGSKKSSFFDNRERFLVNNELVADEPSS